MVLPKDFALAVVASSSPDLSVQEKFELYIEAFEFIQTKSAKEKPAQTKNDPIKTVRDLKKMGL
ncbi:hypothetical protein CI088_14295 [Enterococcus plantarum]|uniref:Uncharacterized protein n=1 Tax=Enterococcus plantarum TaxID=1077675 RepID=A0A2W4BDK7_9ENTE|nr:hypothetical protein CI088_14295 [Enterococcus plantarum]